MSQISVYTIFTDIKGFSKLSEQQTIEFQETINHQLAAHLKQWIEKAMVWNTWGDAIFAAFTDGVDAGAFLLAYRDFFNDKNIDGVALKPRIGAHFGQAKLLKDPLNHDLPNLFGKNINTTARIEPITRPGEIFVTQHFKQAYEALHLTKDDIAFDPLGIVKLAKKFGAREIFRLRRATEPKQVLDKLAVEDLTQYIPEIPNIADNEKERLEDLLARKNKGPFIKDLADPTLVPADASLKFLFQLAEHCKKLGAYEQCIELLDRIEKGNIEVEGVAVHPFKYMVNFKKLKANALTRLGHYKEAADLIYGLWHAGHQDSDTLCMLAAQYKRRAIFGQTKVTDIASIDCAQINKSLLERASKLYIEAFRSNINDYYPAINAAYLYLMLNDKTYGNGTQLALYIKQVWESNKGENWWLDATLAEAEMLAGFVDEANEDFRDAINTHSPSAFDLTATKEQIDIYAKVSNKKQALRDILETLGG